MTLVSTWPSRPQAASRSRSRVMRSAMTARAPVPFHPVARRAAISTDCFDAPPIRMGAGRWTGGGRSWAPFSG
jgi:hypothetical protein